MDEDQMHAWIDVVLKLYKDDIYKRDHDGPPPILILDVYCFHQMGSVVNHIEAMGIEVIHIPVGYTNLCQPIDMGINKPLKNAMHARWEEWMMNDVIVHGRSKEPSRKQVTDCLLMRIQAFRSRWARLHE